jgi:hypothetical protein
VSSKQTKNIFGLNRKEPKQNLFRLFFGLFRETQKKFFRFVSVFRTRIETTETNKSVSKKTETNKKNFVNCTPLGIAYTGLLFVGRHVQMQHKTLVDRLAQVQHKALVDRHAQVQHRLLKTDTFRCSTKLLQTDTHKCSTGSI